MHHVCLQELVRLRKGFVRLQGSIVGITCSSLSLEDLESLILERSSNFTNVGVSFGGVRSKLLELKLLFLTDLEQVNLNGVVSIKDKGK